MRYKLLALCLIFFTVSGVHSASIFFPEFNVYSEMNQSGQIASSYRMDLVIDTGLKYGVKMGIGLKQYQITTMSSNFMILDSIRLYTSPFNLFTLGYFMGKNTTFGKSEIGYQGFQYHNRTNLEYVGFGEIRGTGLEIFRAFFDNVFEPHLYIYAPDNTNLVNFDLAALVKGEKFELQGFFGLNNLLQKRFGLFLKTILAKVDFEISLYSPTSEFADFPLVDSLYFSITEHLLTGMFEQTLGVFSRPYEYNGYAENVRGDIDIYLALGMRIGSFGWGVENSILFAESYDLTDRLGLYVYFAMNNLRYKIGGYYNILPADPTKSAYDSQYGGFVQISGSL